MTGRAPGERPSSEAAFWDERFACPEPLFGTRPRPFIAHALAGIPPGASAVDLGGGGGRHAVHLARRGVDVTVVDFAEEGLAAARALSEAAGVTLRLVHADLTRWRPDRTWDAALATFVQLLPDERPAFWRLAHDVLRPGGRFAGVFFRPEQLGYTSGGPPTPDRMISAAEVRAAFGDNALLAVDEAVVTLNDGPHLRGPAAVLHVAYRRPEAD